MFQDSDGASAEQLADIDINLLPAAPGLASYTIGSPFYCLPPKAEAVDKRALLLFFKSSLPFQVIEAMKTS